MMKTPFFLQMLNMSTTHAMKSREGFQQLNLSDGQPKILYILQQHDGSTQKELAKLCWIRESTLTIMLGKLLEKGLICKESSLVSGGKRAFRIYLTDAGKEMTAKINAFVEELDAQSLSGFTPDEIKQFYEFMDRVVHNLEE